MTFYGKNIKPLLLNAMCLILFLCLAGCRTTSHEVIKYENEKVNITPHALVPGLEKECNYCQECFGFCKGGKIIHEMEQAYN